jgi:hypothetical protein
MDKMWSERSLPHRRPIVSSWIEGGTHQELPGFTTEHNWTFEGDHRARTDPGHRYRQIPANCGTHLRHTRSLRLRKSRFGLALYHATKRTVLES